MTTCILSHYFQLFTGMINFISHHLPAFTGNIFFFVMQEPEDKSDMFVISGRACERHKAKYQSHVKLLWKLFGFENFKDAFMLLPFNVSVSLIKVCVL